MTCLDSTDDFALAHSGAFAERALGVYYDDVIFVSTSLCAHSVADAP